MYTLFGTCASFSAADERQMKQHKHGTEFLGLVSFSRGWDPFSEHKARYVQAQNLNMATNTNSSPCRGRLRNLYAPLHSFRWQPFLNTRRLARTLQCVHVHPTRPGCIQHALWHSLVFSCDTAARPMCPTQSEAAGVYRAHPRT